MRKKGICLLLSAYGLVLLVCLLPYSFAIDNIAVWEADSMTKVKPSDPVQDFDNKITINSAKNENENFQVVLTPSTDINDVGVSISDLTGPGTISKDDISIYLVGYVHSSGSMLPDPLIPISSSFDLTAGNNQPIWFKVRVSKNTAPGLYAGTITITAGGQSRPVPVELVVWDFTLPDTPSLKSLFGVTNSFSSFYSQSSYDDKLKLLKKFYDRFAENRLNPIKIAYDYLYDFYDAYTWNGCNLVGVDFSKMDPIYEYCADELKFQMIAFPISNYVPVRWDRANGVGCGDYSWDDYEISERFKTAQKQYINIVGPHFDDKGWLDRSFTYLTDEPCPNTKRFSHPSSHPSYKVTRDYYDLVQGTEPRIKKIETEQVEPALFGYNNIWVPHHSLYNEFDADERRPQGEEVWWYNVGTRISTPGVQTRAIYWDSYSRNVDGVLEWGVNYWTYNAINNDPWQGSTVDGDGYLLYPGPEAGQDDDFVTSIRWENAGDGMEDYEYLKLLEAKYNKAYVRSIAENIGKGSYFAKARFEEKTSEDLLDMRRYIAEKIMDDSDNQVWYDSFITLNNIETIDNLKKGYSQEGNIGLMYSAQPMVLDDFETDKNWQPSNQQDVDSSFSITDEQSSQGQKSGRFSFRRTGVTNTESCYTDTRNSRVYWQSISPSDWSDYDYLEFDIYPKEITFQTLTLQTNFGFSDRIGSYSLQGSLPGKWSHVRINLNDYDTGSVSTFGPILHSNNMEEMNHDYVFYIDNLVLQKKEFKTSGTIISKPIHLSGVNEFNSIEWACEFTKPAGTDLRFFTSSSADGISWDGWSEVTYDADDVFRGTINSPADDYIRYKVEFYSDGDETPTLSEIRINYNGDEVCSGKAEGDSCYDGYVCCGGRCIFGECCSDDDCSVDKTCSDFNFCTPVIKPQCTDADADSSGEISNQEIMDYINRWLGGKTGITLHELMDAIDRWKNGCS